ncbi:MAG: hypothetical protein NVS2B15_25760 [Pseudarthrobacter sp.]
MFMTVTVLPAGTGSTFAYANDWIWMVTAAALGAGDPDTAGLEPADEAAAAGCDDAGDADVAAGVAGGVAGLEPQAETPSRRTAARAPPAA